MGFLLSVVTLDRITITSDSSMEESGLGSSPKQGMNLEERENKRIHELKRDRYKTVTR